MSRLRVLGAVCLLAATALTGCGSDSPEDELTVLASSELVDMQPLLDELREDTGVRLRLDYQGTVDASNALVPLGRDHHDLAWLSTDSYFQLKLATSGHTGEPPLSKHTMVSSVAIGVKPAIATALRAGAVNGQVSWADIAEMAATGQLRFAMADPRHSGSGLTALIGVATAAAATGKPLRPEDVTCDRLHGLFSGQVAADTSQDVLEAYRKNEGGLDGVVNYESTLLSLNARGGLRTPLEIIRPKDGAVLSEYPVLLLNPAKRRAYDAVVEWLLRPDNQRKIMATTFRRAVTADVEPIEELRVPIGTALYFPDRQEVVDKLLTYYESQSKTRDVIFVLDYSGSMRGASIAALRSAFEGLSGADTSDSGKFARFANGEQVTVVRFAQGIVGEQTVAVTKPADLDALRRFVAVEDFGEGTAVWAALERGYQVAADHLREDPDRVVSVVLMTDGLNNAGPSAEDFLAKWSAPDFPARAVRTYTIRFGEASAAELDRVATTTGGHMVDATATSLSTAFKEIRGCD
ncbi:substrate-binding domain-containing protein [Actinokineospora sp. NBRC 105648]|uniref:vWA domain-containing protein n=1 Tax=Actinokineospora sp. NBRC 105648 TaxID=3032206 RepID=UPI0024A4E0E8|nr:substrate-binding domain-containing protein [Actinokineospora sp. NBRC 105648]GLZ39918.1 VWA domain-containing protein [Actinokineospora sp. NBRC 105648]